jgi:hypothetical protein
MSKHQARRIVKGDRWSLQIVNGRCDETENEDDDEYEKENIANRQP